MATLTFTIKGATPLLMHSDRFADPLDPATKAHKALTSKRTKTDEDHAAIARSEMMGGLYYNGIDGIHIPGENVKACIVRGAVKNKLGSTVKASAWVVDMACELIYSGPKTPEGIADNTDFWHAKSVRVGTAKLMRYRPIFREWGLKFTVEYADDQINRDEVIMCVENAGRLVGLGDWRPEKGGTFGRFEVAEVV